MKNKKKDRYQLLDKFDLQVESRPMTKKESNHLTELIAAYKNKKAREHSGSGKKVA